MVAFAIDIGTVAYARTELQATTDAGDLAGPRQSLLPLRRDAGLRLRQTEVNKYVGSSAGNMPGLSVADADIQFGYFDPVAAIGTRFSTDLTNRRANALRVTLRRDGPPTHACRWPSHRSWKDGQQLQARATAWMPPALGVLPDAELIPTGRTSITSTRPRGCPRGRAPPPGTGTSRAATSATTG